MISDEINVQRMDKISSGSHFLLLAACIFATLLAAGCAKSSKNTDKASTNNAIAQPDASSVFPIGTIAANKDDYTGTIWLNILHKSDSTFPFNVDLATYKPGSKLNWYIHPGGQILLITQGTGYYQEKGKPVQTVHKGDVITCPPGVEHWHAAAPNSSFAYIAVTPTQKGTTIWLKPVSDQDYNSAK
ncbi:MAG TPA: cupin domain-containing protein [Terracidiphilus sp.]|nr:cupin domain-containing protein [Terracidiphilus sp.]